MNMSLFSGLRRLLSAMADHSDGEHIIVTEDFGLDELNHEIKEAENAKR